MKKIVLVTALSGSGKATAAQALVEEGYVILENIDSSLMVEVLELLLHGEEADKIAIVVKLCEKEKFEYILRYINEIRFLVKMRLNVWSSKINPLSSLFIALFPRCSLLSIPFTLTEREEE